MPDESHFYLDHAMRDIDVATKNLELGYFHVTISRAYYAMFYAASALLASKNITRSRHSGVLSAFGENFVRTGEIEPEYARMLGNAFDSRLDSDYDVTFVPDHSMAEEVLKDAGSFVERIRRYFEENVDEKNERDYD
jgi:uncharacterized protein (UPF0332 family)